MRNNLSVIRKKFYNNPHFGFTLVELLTVIVILGILMLIAVPSVLNIIQASRIKSFVVYTDKMINKSSERIARGSIYAEDEKSCVIYDIKKDFDIDNTGDFVGWVLLNNDTDEKFITIYNDEYALVGYKVDNNKKIEDYLVKIDDSIIEKLNIETLCELSNCYSCSVTPSSDEDPENGTDEIIPKNRIALLQTGHAINKKIDELSGATGYYNDKIKRIVFTDEIEDKSVNIADESSFYDIYLWVKDSVAYIGCESPVIYLNKNSKRFFGDFRSLVSIDGLYKLNTSLMTNAEYFFYYDKSLKSLDLSNFDTSNCTSFFCAFMYCNGLTSLDLSHFDTSKVDSFDKMFCECRNLVSIDLSSFNTSRGRIFGLMFEDCESLVSLDLKHFDTRRATSMSHMFSGCKSLSYLDISSFKTDNVTNMGGMFASCKLLETLDLSHFKTSRATDMRNMFKDCTSLKTLNISNFDTSKVTNMSYMFYNTTGITNSVISVLDTRSVTTMCSMFYGVTGISDLDLSHFDTSKVTDFSQMFYKAKFNTLNLSSFDTSSASNMSSMFYYIDIPVLDLSSFVIPANCSIGRLFAYSTVRTIYASSNWSEVSGIIGKNAFRSCYNLSGAVNYSSFNDNDYTLANYSTGYFTYKSKA